MNKYHVAVNGNQTGPYDLEALRGMNLDRATLVWTKGMRDWKPAGEVEELKSLWQTRVTPAPSGGGRDQSPPPPRPPGHVGQASTGVPSEPPKTWLVESILVTLFCCMPFGIAGIVNASEVSSRHAAGNVEGAARASREAKKWTMIGLWVGVGLVAVYLLWMLFAVISRVGAAVFQDVNSSY